MGAYLSSPKTEKFSEDMESDLLACGVSSMQGWRVSQEDAHNCMLRLDKDTALFAVYDGHGGAEVAKYCSLYLPEFLLKHSEYIKGNLEEALRCSFVEFDQTLTKPEVVAELRSIAHIESDSEDEEETKALLSEAAMPLKEVLARYNGGLAIKDSSHLQNLKDKKPMSPMLHAKKDSEDQINGVAEEDPATTKEVVKNSSKKSAKVDGASNSVGEEGNPAGSEAKPAQETECGPSSSGGGLGGGDPDSGVDCNKPSGSSKKDTSATWQESEESESSDEEYAGSSEEEEEEEEEEEGMEEEEESEDEERDALLPAFTTSDEPGSDSGCTAVLALLRGNKLVVANAGDSRCVVCRGGQAHDMSMDHKPDDSPEKERILKAGGQVTADGRVNGGLNLSRAIGDHSYKRNTDLKLEEQMITALPDVKVLELDMTQDEFVVLACDGIWNFMSSQQVVDFIREHLPLHKDHLSSICEELFDACLAPNTMGDGTGCDNMTCIIVRLKESKKRKTSSSPEAKRPKLE